MRYCAKLKAGRQVKNINTKQHHQKNAFGWDFSFLKELEPYRPDKYHEEENSILVVDKK